jgi:hypothetical protein
VQASGRHIGRGDEQLQWRIGTHRLEIDEAIDEILERIYIERVEIIGREVVRHRVEPCCHRRAFERHEREQTLDQLALDHRQVAVDAGSAPEVGQARARDFGSAAGEAVGDHHRIHCARRGP